MKVAVIGGRDFKDYELVKKHCLNSLQLLFLVVL
jgi:hypothetical protein